MPSVCVGMWWWVWGGWMWGCACYCGVTNAHTLMQYVNYYEAKTRKSNNFCYCVIFFDLLIM